MKKNNTVEKTIQKADKITEALKENTKKTLQDILNETVSNLVKESENEEDEFDNNEDDSYEEEDVAIAQNSTDADNEESDENVDDEDASDEEVSDEEGEEDDWSDMEDYKVGDNDYDCTSMEGDDIIKVYNKMGDDDQIFIQKEDDGTYSVKDDESGAEFTIELNPDVLDSEEGDTEFEYDDEEGDDEFEDDSDFEYDDEEEDDDEFEDNTEFEFDDEEGDDDIEFDDEEGDDDIEFDDEEGDDDIEFDDEEGDDDIEFDDEEEINEDFGYTTKYQREDPIKGLKMNEPANSKATYSMDGGVPQGTERPYGKKAKSDINKPFDNTINECGDQPIDESDTVSSIDAKHMKKTKVDQHRPNAPQYDVKKVDSPMNESIQKIIAKAKEIQNENKQYKNCINKIKTSLYEAAVLNVNLGRLVDILVNETTTKEEKKSICEKFNSVKTLDEGKAVYNAIKSTLKEAKKSSSPIVEKQFIAESTKNLNETTIFANDPSLDLMKRMENLYK